jgi:hypothetical protein
MAQEKPLDLAVVQAWLSAWNDRDIFSDASVRHLQSLITDPLCLVVVTLGGGPRTAQPPISPHEADDTCTNSPASRSEAGSLCRLDDGRFQIHMEKRQGEEGTPGKREGQSVGSRQPPQLFPEMPVSPVAPVAPSVGQLWHQTGVMSKTVPKWEMVLRWDGTGWVIAGLVSDNATIMKQASGCAISRKRSLMRMRGRSGSTANLSIPTMDRLG